MVDPKSLSEGDKVRVVTNDIQAIDETVDFTGTVKETFVEDDGSISLIVKTGHDKVFDVFGETGAPVFGRDVVEIL